MNYSDNSAGAMGELGVVIEQDLQEAVFGLTFVALDPDGHCIRVCMADK